jgi:hypothetical protein
MPAPSSWIAGAIVVLNKLLRALDVPIKILSLESIAGAVISVKPEVVPVKRTLLMMVLLKQPPRQRLREW